MSEHLQALVEATFEYALPLRAVATTRWRAVCDSSNPDRHAPNTLRHIRQLSDHRSRWITAPNNDTLYSNAWLDLSAGPVRVAVAGQEPGRYWSVALLDAASNHIAVLGQRLHGRGPVDVTIAGPRSRQADLPGHVIHAPGDDVWLFARCLVDGPEDLPVARSMQDRISVQAMAAAPTAEQVPPGELLDPQAVLSITNAVLARNPPPPADAQLLSRCARVGLRPGEPDAWQRLDAATQAAWHAHIGGALDRIRRSGTLGRREFEGWIGAAAHIGNFGTRYGLRASVALGGLGALEPEEAMYFVRYTDDSGEPLDGQRCYRLVVPSGGISTDSFWSFTMYQVTPDGHRHFVDNPIKRYSIGNRTTGLRLHADGGLTIVLAHSPPADPSERAHWLPAPAGSFQVALRCYLPKRELREGLASMPSIQDVGSMWGLVAPGADRLSANTPEKI